VIPPLGLTSLAATEEGPFSYGNRRVAEMQHMANRRVAIRARWPDTRIILRSDSGLVRRRLAA
jgi:hypothetical protein